MAQINPGILGMLRGRVGDLVFTVQNGKQHVRSRRQKSDKPPSELQKANREKFTSRSRFFSSLKNLVRITFCEQRKETPYNQAQKSNRRAINGTGACTTIDYSLVLVSKGSLDNVYSSTIKVIHADGILQFSWQNFEHLSRAIPTDKAVVVAYCPALNETIFDIGSARRGDEKAALNVSGFAGHEVHTWLAFCSDNERKSSNSQYAGKLHLQ